MSLVKKECTKCKQLLPLFKFWSWKKIPNNYPSCIECEKASRRQHLQENPMCCRCWISPHTPKGLYCLECDLIMHKRPPRKWIRRKTGLEWCKICEQLPAEENHQYCTGCRKEYTARMRKKKYIERYHTPSMRQRDTARHYATGLLQRKKIKRGLCVYCGDKATDFHHWDYLPKTRNFEDVCRMCHVQLHAVIEILLTLIKARAIRFPSA